MEQKHAYLIIAHNQIELLKCLLSALDDKHNDIYLHLDKKMQAVDQQELFAQVCAGQLFLLPHRMDVKWGDDSQIECELSLLREATKKEYAYYHLLSGVDFPLTSQKEIHQYFAKHTGTEYIQFESPEIDDQVKNRVSKYHLLVKKKAGKSLPYRLFYRISMLLQLPVDRTRSTGIVFQKGANWFSITDSLARYILSQEALIRKQFRFTLCADEMFLQTLVYNSPFRDRIVSNNYCDNYENILYCIDWQRGNPYEFTESDYDYLIHSGMFFARKFNWEKDKRIVLKLLEYIRSKES